MFEWISLIFTWNIFKIDAYFNVSENQQLQLHLSNGGHVKYSISFFTQLIFSVSRLSIYGCGEVFSHNMGMIIPWCGEIGTGKIPPLSLKAHVFPTHGLAVGVKIKFPPSRLRRSGGNFVFTPPATPFVGKTCAFRDSGGILFFPSLFLHTKGLAQFFCYSLL